MPGPAASPEAVPACYAGSADPVVFLYLAAGLSADPAFSRADTGSIPCVFAVSTVAAHYFFQQKGVIADRRICAPGNFSQLCPGRYYYRCDLSFAGPCQYEAQCLCYCFSASCLAGSAGMDPVFCGIKSSKLNCYSCENKKSDFIENKTKTCYNRHNKIALI